MLNSNCLKCPCHQNYYFLIRSYISCNEPWRKKFAIWIKSDFYESFKTWKSYFLAVYPCRWSHDWHAQSCDVDSGTCDLRLDLFRVFYLCKFSFLDHAKCSFPAFGMNYYVKFTKVKQARWFKPEITCSLMYVTTHSKPREDWCEWWTKMTANLNVFKTSKKDCILSIKSNFSFVKVHWVIHRIR